MKTYCNEKRKKKYNKNKIYIWKMLMLVVEKGNVMNAFFLKTLKLHNLKICTGFQ